MYKADEDTQRMIDWAAAAGLPPLKATFRVWDEPSFAAQVTYILILTT